MLENTIGERVRMQWGKCGRGVGIGWCLPHACVCSSDTSPPCFEKCLLTFFCFRWVLLHWCLIRMYCAIKTKMLFLQSPFLKVPPLIHVTSRVRVSPPVALRKLVWERVSMLQTQFKFSLLLLNRQSPWGIVVLGSVAPYAHLTVQLEKQSFKITVLFATDSLIIYCQSNWCSRS